MTGYVISSALWALSGLIVGYSIGRAGQVRWRGVRERNVMAILRSRAEAILGCSLVLLAVLSVIAMVVALAAQRRVVDCQADFNQAFSQAIKERQLGAEQDREAQRRLLESILLGDNSSRDAITRYLDDIAEADTTRTDNPLPDRPACR